MTYQVTVQPEAFQEIEQSYRWLCDNRTPDLANDWYNDLQEAIDSLKTFPRRCPIAPEASFFDREVGNWLWESDRNIGFYTLLKTIMFLFSISVTVVNLDRLRKMNEGRSFPSLFTIQHSQFASSPVTIANSLGISHCLRVQFLRLTCVILFHRNSSHLS